MPLSRRLSGFNRVVTNRLLGFWSERLPWFALLHHRGRITGREYRTPLMAWSDGSSVVVALTYGEEVDWLANTRNAGFATMTIRRQQIELGCPRVVRWEEGSRRVPGVIRALLRLIRSSRFAVFPIR